MRGALTNILRRARDYIHTHLSNNFIPFTCGVGLFCTLFIMFAFSLFVFGRYDHTWEYYMQHVVAICNFTHSAYVIDSSMSVTLNYTS
jgi:hypothetical protein